MRVRAEITLKNDAICEALEAFGWSQLDLARRCRMSPGRLGRIIRFDLHGIGDETIERIAEELGLSFEDVSPRRLHGHAVPSPTSKIVWIDPPGRDHESRIDVRNAIAEALAELPDLEQRIVVRRHGLNGNGEEVVADIARALGLSRGRVEKLERRAKKRLRKSPHLAALQTGGRAAPEGAGSE